MLGRVLLIVATLAIFHAAFSTYEHMSHLKALGKPEGALPQDIVLETILAMLLGIIGSSLNAPSLREITWASEMKKHTIDEMDSRLGFANFVHRGKNVLPYPKPAPSK